MLLIAWFGKHTSNALAPQTRGGLNVRARHPTTAKLTEHEFEALSACYSKHLRFEP